MRNFLRRLIALIGLSVLLAASSSAQIFSPLHTFSTANGFSAPLIQGPDGTLYGTSSLGGAGSAGTVFKLKPDGTHFAILYSFGHGAQLGPVYTNVDGYGPASGLVLSNNVLYGTTQYGGVTGYGTVFKINTDGSGFTTLHFFTNGISGGQLNAGLVLVDGALYGVTYTGGTNNGTVFKLNPDGTGFTNIHNFGGTNGAFPMATLTSSGALLYGTTQEGNNGTVFRMDTNGVNFAVLHHFTATFIGTNIDGALPESSLLLSGSTLYGTTSGGGRGYGTVFAVSTDGDGFTNLYVFTNGVDGAKPLAALVLSGNTLYGTTTQGGPNGVLGIGTIFSINTDGSAFTSITNFAPSRTSGVLGGGAGGLILSGNTFFGAGGGVVFSVLTNGQNGTVLANGSDGAKPLGGLALSGNTAYGTTSAGGLQGSGIIFSMNTNGTSFDTLYTFSVISNSVNADGAIPLGTLVLAGGKLFGVTRNGGLTNAGTIFSINTNGTGFTTLHSFAQTPDGMSPYSGLILAGEALYGTTRNGGISNSGTIFKINTDGSDYETIYNFTNFQDPESSLIFSGGILYGTTYSGGTKGDGMVFKVSTNGTGFTELCSFKTPTNGFDTINVNGANPVGGPLLFNNTVYGTTFGGGDYSSKSAEPGTVFKVNTDGTGFARLHLFNFFAGGNPMAGMALSGNTLYGTSTAGGSAGGGTVFQLDTDGNNFTTLHSFSITGSTPLGDLIVTNGVIYGTTELSDTGSGYVFSVTPTAAPTIHFTATPTSGPPPTTVQFNSPAVDNFGNSISSWHWDFGDGTNSTAQNPSHTYSNNITYTPTLIVTNNNGATVIGFGPAITLAYPSSILNGGFETGTFTNWTRTGNYTGSTLSTSTQYKHSGTYGVRLSAATTLGYFSQTITTTPGNLYLVSLWFDSPFNGNPNEFSVTWGTNVLMDLTNIPNIGWTNIQFFVTAATNATTLQLGYRSDTFFLGLDDVSVVSAQPVIGQLTLSGANLVLNSTGGISNRTYVLLSSTNPVAPLAQWLPIATNLLGSNGVFSLTATNAVDHSVPRQYFILQMQ